MRRGVFSRLIDCFIPILSNLSLDSVEMDFAPFLYRISCISFTWTFLWYELRGAHRAACLSTKMSAFSSCVEIFSSVILMPTSESEILRSHLLVFSGLGLLAGSCVFIQMMPQLRIPAWNHPCSKPGLSTVFLSHLERTLRLGWRYETASCSMSPTLKRLPSSFSTSPLINSYQS